ncbi:MAG: hypothetical protein H0W84_09725, partial [Bacteroidetes bacterium]|nr:hypothetical protein [Bacteroidota bacterium]
MATRFSIFLIFCVSVLFTTQAYSQGMGIGIATPISVLHVYENTANVSTTTGLTIEQNSTGDAVIQYLLTGGQRWVEGIDNSDADKFKISSTVDVGSNPRITIQTTGEVGINKSAPDEMFHVGTNSGATDNYVKVQTNGSQKAGIKFVGGTLNIWHVTHDDVNSILQIGMDASEWMTFNNTGSVGIGTASP